MLCDNTHVPMSPDEYNLAVETANNKGYDIKEYTDIVDIGNEYVSEKFAWETPGYFWKSNNLTSADENTPVDDVTFVENSGTNTYEQRREIYEKVKKYIN